MQKTHRRGLIPVVLLTLTAAVGCAPAAKLSVGQSIGAEPALPEPKRALIPTINVVTAKQWPAGATPVAADGTQVVPFARDLDHPRWIYVLPNGDVLVAETNAPERPEEHKGFKGWMFKRFQKEAGGAVPSANRITLLRDTDGDGVADVRRVFLSGLNSPFGYKVIFVPFKDGRPEGAPIDVLTGFVNDDDEAYGRPVGVAIDTKGGLLVADDVGLRSGG